MTAGAGAGADLKLAKLRSSDDEVAGVSMEWGGCREQGGDVHHPFARLEEDVEDVELGEVRVGQGTKGRTVVKRASVGVDSDD